MAEAFTGIETDLTLLEWSDLNRPLMQRLSLEAPGTYAHTIAIANLAEAACRAIGANRVARARGRVLSRHRQDREAAVLRRESGRRAATRTTCCSPSASAQIIRNHVREGLELARGVQAAARAARVHHRAPRHRNDHLLPRQSATARRRRPDAAEYIYPGPLPQSAETAVVMLADGIEAAARVLHEPTPREDPRRRRAHRAAAHGSGPARATRRSRCARSRSIKDEFTRVLVGMYHNRIDYPAASGGVTSEFASRMSLDVDVTHRRRARSPLAARASPTSRAPRCAPSACRNALVSITLRRPARDRAAEPRRISGIAGRPTSSRSASRARRRRDPVDRRHLHLRRMSARRTRRRGAAAGARRDRAARRARHAARARLRSSRGRRARELGHVAPAGAAPAARSSTRRNGAMMTTLVAWIIGIVADARRRRCSSTRRQRAARVSCVGGGVASSRRGVRRARTAASRAVDGARAGVHRGGGRARAGAALWRRIAARTARSS